MSLYPYVMKNREYPVGRPSKILTVDLLRSYSATLPWKQPEQQPVKGLVLCAVLAPDVLRQTLLPYRTRSTCHLTFPVCASCAEVQASGRCHHTNSQRMWVAAFTHVELNKALSLGYQIVELFEVFSIFS